MINYYNNYTASSIHIHVVLKLCINIPVDMSSEQMTANYGTDDDATYLIDSYDWYFVPIMNPDGYLFSWDDVSVRNYPVLLCVSPLSVTCVTLT